MSQFAAALAGAITAIGVGAVAAARSWPTPGPRAPRVLEESIAVYDIGWCPAEQAEHLHRYATDTRTCCACGRQTPTAVPR